MANAEYHRNWYRKQSPEWKRRKREIALARKLTIQQAVFDYFKIHPCIDCGEADPVVLEFDHCRGEKAFTISDAVGHAWSIERLLDEIDKCDVRCANCHRRKTAKQLNWYKNIKF